MPLRTVLIVLACVLLATSIIGASASEEDQAVKPPEPTTAERGRNLLAGATIRGALPRDMVVQAKVGQLVELTVSSDLFDSVTVAGAGETEAVAPGAPAEFSFVADRAGNYPVSLQISGRSVGRVVVTDPGAAETTPVSPGTTSRESSPAASGGAPAGVR